MTGYGIYLDTALRVTKIWVSQPALTDLLTDMTSRTPSGTHLAGAVITNR